MGERQFKLYKSEKLCSRTAIGELFEGGKSIMAYPLRAVYVTRGTHRRPPTQFYISIPKRKIRTAVGRVLLRRRTREAYRLNRHLLHPTLQAHGKAVDVAFLYLADVPASYATIERKMQDILTKIAQAVALQGDE